MPSARGAWLIGVEPGAAEGLWRSRHPHSRREDVGDELVEADAFALRGTREMGVDRSAGVSRTVAPLWLVGELRLGHLAPLLERCGDPAGHATRERTSA